MDYLIKSKDCACSMRDGLYFPCLEHERMLPNKIREFMRENGRSFFSD